MSREGSGRVAVFKLTGLVRCYTLECNYNTGRLVNTLPISGKDHGKTTAAPVVPPKYNPPLFEEVLFDIKWLFFWVFIVIFLSRWGKQWPSQF